MRTLPFALTLALGVLAWPSGTAAHHSTAMFDRGQEVTLVGTIAEFQWTNPHAWIQVAIARPDGTVVEWSIECGSPNTLSRQGWMRSMLVPGETIELVVNPMFDGTSAGLFVGMTLEDGRVFGDVSAQSGGQG